MSVQTKNQTTGQWENIAGDGIQEPFTGATSSANGTQGQVPQPLIADRNKFLKGDGTWATPPSGGGGGGTTDIGLSIVNGKLCVTYET